MLDAAVDLVEHPRRGARLEEQIARLGDEIVIVEHGLGALPPLIVGIDGVGESEHGAARFRHTEPRELLATAASIPAIPRVGALVEAGGLSPASGCRDRGLVPKLADARGVAMESMVSAERLVVCPIAAMGAAAQSNGLCIRDQRRRVHGHRHRGAPQQWRELQEQPGQAVPIRSVRAGLLDADSLGISPVGFVMGNCVYYVPPRLLQAQPAQSCELSAYTHALYDARELASSIAGRGRSARCHGDRRSHSYEKQHSWRANPWNIGNAALQTGEVIELFVIGTAVVPTGQPSEIGRASLVRTANDVPAAPAGGSSE